MIATWNHRTIPMRKILLASACLLIALPVSAADVSDPVREVMRVTEKNWSSIENEWVYLFDPDPLGRLFSRQFQAAYREASKRPAYDTENGSSGDPFGYDVVTASQDGCPLEDVTLEAGQEQQRITRVKVTFKLWRCLDEPQLRESVNEVHFDVMQEDGRYVIHDIHRVGPEDEDSVLAEMRQHATETY